MANKAVNASLMTFLLLSMVSGFVHARPVDIQDDLFLGAEDGSITGNVFANDVTAATLVFTSITPPPGAAGAFNLQPNGDLTFDPAEHTSGVVTFSYTAFENGPACVTLPADCFGSATVTIFVAPVADPPAFSAGTPSGDEETAIPLGMSLTLDDLDGSEAVQMTIDGLPTGSTLSTGVLQGDGSYILAPGDVAGASLTPPLDFSGTINVGVTIDVVDSAVDHTATLIEDPISVSGSINVTVDDVNDDPYATGFVPTFATNEDTDDTLDLDGIVDDVDRTTNGDTLSYEVRTISNSAVASASMGGSILSVTVAPDQNQLAGDITVRVSDSFGEWVEVSIPVDVAAVNDDPFLDEAVPSLDTTEDVVDSVDLDGVVDDVDIATNSDFLLYNIISVDNAAIDVASLSGSTLTVTPLAEAFGSGSVTVQVSDNGGGVPVDVVVPVNISAVNDDPFATGLIPAFSTTEDVDATLDLDGIVDDVDLPTGDSLTYEVRNIGNSAVASASMGGSVLSVTVAPDQNELAGNMTIRVSDSAGEFVDVIIPVDVLAVNDDPYLDLAVPSLDTVEDVGDFVDLVGVVADVDIGTNADVLSYAITAIDNVAIDTASLSGTVLSVTVLPDAFQTGGSVTVQVSDANGGIPVDVVVPVNIAATNDDPFVASAPAPVIAAEDDAPVSLDLSAAFDDVDIATGDSLSLTASFDSGDAIFDSINMAGDMLTLTFTANANGNANVLIEATDSGAVSVSLILNVDLQAVNDQPVVVATLANANIPEDSPPQLVSLVGIFDDVDIATNADTLTFEVFANSNPGIFSSVSIGGDTLTFALLADANGSADISLLARDAAGLASVPTVFTVIVDGVDDLPDAADDALTAIPEDTAELRIDVLANDYLGDVPSIISAIIMDNHNVVDVNGDIIVTPNGAVVIDGTEVVFTPAENFWGNATFQYVLQDSNGDEDTATVSFYIDPENDAPEGLQTHSYTVFEGATLTVDPVVGLLVGAYDIDPSQVDGNGDPLAPQPLSVVFETAPPPAEGTLLTTASDGSFTFEPVGGFTGQTSFTYTVFDNTLKSEIGTVLIEVLPLPPAGVAPNPGEVAVNFNLANTPLEQSATVAPNVLVTMDDSGSMDWHVSVDSTDDNGRYVINNSGIATSNVLERLYTYLFDLNVNAYSSTSGNGRILPSEESLPAGNDYQVWRGRSSTFNGIYYDPTVAYEPWTGLDNGNNDFDDADPAAIRLDPMSTANTFDILTLKNYLAADVPSWQTGGGSANINVTNFYIPRYYTATGTRVEITAANAPFQGGPERDDCAAGNGTCTYAEEIQNFANWFQYYRSRELVAKAAIGNVVAELQDIRVGYETINRRSDEPIASMNEYYWEGEKKELLDTIYEVNSSGGTPLRRALDDAGQILGCNMAGRTCPSLPAPEGICQQNFSLLFSDGYWNGSTPRAGNFDQDGVGPFDGGKYADTHSDTLADIAMFYYEDDLFPAVNDGVPLATSDIDGAPDGTFTSSNDLIHQHMKTFTIAFGVEPDIDPLVAEQALATASFTWPSPTSAANAKIDDMLHAAINGRGRFLNAGDAQDLQVSVGTAFLEFTQAASSTSAATFNSTSLRDGTLLYRGFYDLRNRTGELTATEVSTNGIIAATPTWTAAQLLDADNPLGLQPAERVLVTYNPNTNSGTPFRYNEMTAAQQVTLSENQVDYMRGMRTFEEPSGTLRARLDDEGLLGDIVNSSPVFVGVPRAINRDQSPFPTDDLYSDFVNTISSRQQMVYVGANDGMLHGFNALNGTEIMGYVPNLIIDSTKPYSNKLNAFTSAFYLHDYYVDLSPRLNDVYMRPSTTSSKQWMTTLVGGLGAGGKGFFALNVTDPGTLFASEAAARAAVLWEFTDDDDTYPEDISGDPIGGAVDAIVDPNGDPVKDMGFSLSLPVITMSNALDTDSENEWVALFGNGTNSTSGIATLFVLFMDKGMDGWAPGDFVKISTGFGVPLPGETLEGYPNALGSPTAVDRDLNGTVDLVYAGDRLGNLYRFELESADTDSWRAVRLFTASYDDNGTDTIQPILSKPLVVGHPDQNGFLVTVGTGSFIAEEDGSDTTIQSVYTIWDQLVTSPPTANADTKATRLVQQTLTNVVDDSVSPAQTRRILSNNPVSYTPETGVPGVYGWYIDLNMVRAADTIGGVANTDISGQAPPDPQFPGERAIRRLIFRDGVILTTTVLPATDATSCFGSRPGAILIFDGLTGGDPVDAVIDFNLDGYVDQDDLLDVNGENFSAGLLFDYNQLDGQLVDLSTLGGEGDTDFLFVSGGNDTISYRIRDLNDNKTGRLSWSELQAD